MSTLRKSAEYEAERAYRQYNKADPENRLVCAQLENKWNMCLKQVEEIKERLDSLQRTVQPLKEDDRKELLKLSLDLPQLWNMPSTTNEIRKRIIRTVVKEITCDIDEANHLILFDMHWAGGIHTKLEIKKNMTGEHRRCTDGSIVELVRELSKILSDKAIAPVLNRLKLKTGSGKSWTRDRVRWLRNYNGIEPYSGEKQVDVITLKEAAARLGVCAQSVSELIKRQIIKAHQVIPCAPWLIAVDELEKDDLKEAIQRIKSGANRREQYSQCKYQMGLFQ